MSNLYQLISPLAGGGGDLYTLDIKVPVESGSLLQAIQSKSEANEYWTFQPMESGSSHYYILSADQGLAVDIRDPVQPGALVQALVMKPSPNEHNQHWQMVPVSDTGEGDVDDLPWPDGMFAIMNPWSGLCIQLSSNGQLSVEKPFPFDPAALAGSDNNVPADQGGNQLWQISPVGQPTVSPSVEIVPPPGLSTPYDPNDGTLTVHVKAAGFLPGQGLAVTYSFDSFNSGSMTNNLGYPPIYTADFGGNIDVFISMVAPGAGAFEFTVTGTQEPYSASATINLADNGEFYQ
jgi:hypothetical protein